MRLHISLPDDLVAEVDRAVGPRDRSAFIARAVRRALDDAVRLQALDAALGAIDGGHDWDDDPGAWVRKQRSDARRTG
jgi:Arc/MetJ-type ribon-helix-helix transcriptional regulator